MPEDNNAKTQFIIDQINVKISRQNDVIGFGTVSVLKQPLDRVNELIESYDPPIKGIDAKIVSIGQSINQIKDEIIVLITNAVGPGTTGCGVVPIGICTQWGGGISTCLVGFATEYYDTVTANNWGFDENSDNPFTASSTILSSASNSFGVGVGTFLFHTQNNTSYSAGNRVGLGASAACVAIQDEIDRKDAEIAALRSEFGKYMGVVNSIREERWRSQLERWGLNRSKKQSEIEKARLVGVLTAFTDSTYTSLFLK
ncbi:hypothetical protein S820908_018 [Synechococcus phage S-CAM9]|uniref:Uncharacterized protein n=1 Tax=Synechococcus phage S-CAM9 TaxID=1883369 RepID=A0A1D8KND2_9CAUD|nr:hypothetical protein BOW85_gp018 [Synechococcus phage S-CAM9]AOV60165.1 hypothetical protein S050808_018 [Synechococcus phage S-CAM9]AOV60393.1 hypothetical protein S820908_018 [Synechococcus phage S-CAM9]AOV60621.1 hypothetical protein N161109_018 [Synechococcus phage S-CAM9]